MALSTQQASRTGSRPAFARARASSPRPQRTHDRSRRLPSKLKPSDALLRWANATYPERHLGFETDQFMRYWRSDGRRKKSWPTPEEMDRRLPQAPGRASPDRRQQATDDQFDRAMQRAQAREAGTMTPSETVLFIRYVRACCPQQAIDEYTADAWHDVLACEPWLTLADARAAVVQIKRRQPFADVSEVIAQAKATRSQQHELELAERAPQPGRRALSSPGPNARSCPTRYAWPSCWPRSAAGTRRELLRMRRRRPPRARLPQRLHRRCREAVLVRFLRRADPPRPPRRYRRALPAVPSAASSAAAVARNARAATRLSISGDNEAAGTIRRPICARFPDAG